MSFLEHLDELRKRLIYICWSLLAGCIVAYIFIVKIFDFIMRPLQQMLGPGGYLQYTSGAEPFMLYVKIGFLAGIFIASPLILYQVWKFIAPGLYSHEKKFAIPFVLMSTIFFVAGGLFSHYVAFPWTWQFFISFSTDYMKFVPKVDEAFSHLHEDAARLRRHLRDADAGLLPGPHGRRDRRLPAQVLQVRHPRHLHRRRRGQPGTDVMSMIVFAIPMLGLYLISIVIAFIFQKRKKPATD